MEVRNRNPKMPILEHRMAIVAAASRDAPPSREATTEIRVRVSGDRLVHVRDRQRERAAGASVRLRDAAA